MIASGSTEVTSADAGDVRSDAADGAADLSGPRWLLSPRGLHGGMDAAERAAALAALRSGELRCLVTTDVAARGLHVASVRHVILFDMPASTQAYVHRAGRTARAGGGGLVSCVVRGGSGFAREPTGMHTIGERPR